MKTKYTSIRLSLFFVLSLFTLSLVAQQPQDYYSISGKVKDRKTNKELEAVTVSVPGSSIATVTNEDGDFTLKIKDSHQFDIITFSRLGYHLYNLPIKEKKDVDGITVLMQVNNQKLAEVEVRPNDPESIIREAIANVKDNYSDKNNMLTAFYRETVKKGRNYINVTEAIINAYKTPYTQNNLGERVKIYKGRKIVSPKRGDTLIVKLIGGPNISVYSDIVKESEGILLNLESMPYFRYTIDRPVMIEGRPHHVINFEPQVILPYALYKGKYYIDKDTYNVSQIDYSLVMDDRDKATQAILIKKPYKLKFKPKEVFTTVRYKQQDGRSYLSYIRNNIRFDCDWKKKLFFFSTNFEVVSEMVVTDKMEENVSNIPRKMAFNRNQALSDKVSNFTDMDFWEDYNIIEPSETLESAVNKLRKKYD